MQPQRHFSATLAVCTGMIMELGAALTLHCDGALWAQTGNSVTVPAIVMMHSSDVTVFNEDNYVMLYDKPNRKTYLYIPASALPFAKFRLVVEAAGQSGDNRWPNLALAFNDTTKILKEITVNSSAYQSYDLGVFSAPAGAALYLIFTNDYYNPVNTADVNLKIRQSIFISAAQDTLFVVKGQQLKLAWNRSGEKDVAGYRIYQGLEPGKYGSPIEVSKDSTSHLFNVSLGFKYYFAVAAYDTAQNQSALSPEIIAQVLPPDITLSSDFNKDGKCDSFDVTFFTNTFGSTCTSARYKRVADFNSDCKIDGIDQLIFSKNCK